MMKKILVLTLLLAFTSPVYSQGYFTIPDQNFANALALHVSGISGNQMDTTSAAVLTLDSLDISYKNVNNITGIKYFRSLKFLDVQHNSISTLPEFPDSVLNLRCNNNFLSGLDNLPNGLKKLSSQYNALSLGLPNHLPDSLIYLNCMNNNLTVLPHLPSTIRFLFCNNNNIMSLPDTLPDDLEDFCCSSNSISVLPTLPNKMWRLLCDQNNIVNMPSLPDSLTLIDCSFNKIHNLPAFPPKLNEFWGDGNPISGFPQLPASLTWLMCDRCELMYLPTLPPNLFELDVDSNHITCFPVFPSSISFMDISGNPFTCVPNYVAGMDAATLAKPICTSTCSAACIPSLFDSLYQDVAPYTWDLVAYYSGNVDSVKWAWGDGTETVAFYPQHTYSAPGWYTICGTAYSNCGDSVTVCLNDSLYKTNSSMVNVNIVSFVSAVEADIRSLEVSIYPNPASTELIIEPHISEAVTVIMTSSAGVEVIRKNISGREKLPTSDINDGLYILTVFSKNGVVNRKVIVSNGK